MPSLKFLQVFFVIFVAEAVLKIIALGPRKYFSDNWNIFDFIIVLFAILELALEGVQGLSILRATRLVGSTKYDFSQRSF